MHGFLDGKKLHVLCKNNSAQKIANDRLLKILVSALSSGIVWIDIPSVSVVSGLANFSGSNKGVIKAHKTPFNVRTFCAGMTSIDPTKTWEVCNCCHQ